MGEENKRKQKVCQEAENKNWKTGLLTAFSMIDYKY